MRLRYTVSMFRSCDLLLLSLSALSFLTGCSETLTDGTTVLSNEPVSFRVDAIDGTPVSNASASAKGSRASADAASPTARTPDPQSYFAGPMKITGSGHTLYLHPLVSDRVGGAAAAKVTDEPTTRGTRIESISQLTQFGVSAIPYANDNAFASATPNSLFYNETATNASYGWKTTNEHYWPATDKVAFYAYAPIPSSSNGLTLSPATTQGTPYIDYALPTTPESQPDLIVAVNKGLTLATAGTNKAVPLTFDHQLTSIRFVAGPDMPTGKITSVSFTGIATKGRLSLGDNWTTTATGNYAISNMDLTLTGEENQDIVSGTKTLLMIPQSFTSDNQTIAITYVFDGNTYNLTGSLKGTSWGKGQSVVYKVSPHSVSRLQLGTITFDSSWGSNYPKTAFSAKDNDAVGIYVADANGLKYNNVKLTLGSDGKWTSASRVLLPENCKYYVYYPYSANGLDNTGKAATDAAAFFASGIASWSPKADQSSSTNLYASDLQVAAGTVSTTNASTVNFSMSHQMGLAVITLKSGTVTNHYLSTDKNYTFTNTQTMKATNSFIGNDIPYNNTTDIYIKVLKQKQSTTFASSTDVLGKWDTFNMTANSAGEMVTASVTPSTTQPYFLKLGDVYYSDGALSHNTEITSNKTAVGIVFMTSTSSIDQTHGWKHGYVLSLHEGTKNLKWSSSLALYNVAVADRYESMAADLDGYTKCQNIVKRSDYSSTNFPAIYDAMNYKAKAKDGSVVSLSGNCSGWYLPSSGQWINIGLYMGKVIDHFNDYFVEQGGYRWQKSYCSTITVRNNLNMYLKPLVDAGYPSGTSVDYFSAVTTLEGSNTYDPFYLTSTETDANYEFVVLFGCSVPDTGPDFDFLWRRPKKDTNSNTAIRCVLAF